MTTMTITGILGYALATLLPLLLLLNAYCRSRAANAPSKSVAVIVLGDIGRSPRMMYHAQSLSQARYKVLLVGFAGTPVLKTLQEADNVQTIHIAQPPAWISKLPRVLFLIVAPFKLVFGAISLWYTLVFGLPFFPKAILVQTPPALPTLPMVQLVCKLQNSKLIIDWHNTAYSILGMRLGQSSKPTEVAKKLEGFFGRRAFAHFFVTKQMQKVLSGMWKLEGTKATFADHPQQFNGHLSPEDIHALFSRLPIGREASLRGFMEIYETTSTLFTHLERNGVPDYRGTPVLTASRPALVVSSTSWTADEDFGILLQALELYEKAADDVSSELPKLIVLITGKGPLKQAFEDEIAKREKKWKYVRCKTAWLESEDYPKLLQAADLGISLHSSSSGLDFPMKIVDMFGAGLRVLALDFACVHEGLQEGPDGRVFQTGQELAQQLQEELQNFPKASASQNVANSIQPRGQTHTHQTWQEAWKETVLPIIEKCCNN
ncbi:glycosyltransferase family 33 protein [Cystobasidium minutum MCA 4210]|uniref:glycosyltransferase family 33 protein n=1 Tax=Cystobasidium minutum MCA 4210 TaxID=1397322 RepID=UPI0034CE4B16|eukprot:jgi/Rhomi1/72217/CE72216_801